MLTHPTQVYGSQQEVAVSQVVHVAAVPHKQALVPRSAGARLGTATLWRELEANGIYMLTEGLAFVVRLAPDNGSYHS